MKSKLSMLIDGELDQQEVARVLEELKVNEELREEWKNFHVIGDALRQSSQLSTSVDLNFNKSAKVGPLVLVPKSKNSSKYKPTRVFAYSIAASIIAMVSAWVLMYNQSYQPQQSLVAENTRSVNQHAVPVMVTSPASLVNYPTMDMNDYLFVHREFSPGTGIRGHVTNVNSLIDYDERYHR